MQNPFMSALAEKQKLIGSWSMCASANAAEAMGWVGFDFLTLDIEHAPHTLTDTAACLRAMELTGTMPVVRLPDQDATKIKFMLDAGARTLMVPMVETPEEAERVVSLTRYPPHGKRGYALMTRASRYTAIGDYAQIADDTVAVIAQIETPEALARLEEIAAVPGVDALFIGPGDLSAAMNHRGNPGHEEVRAAVFDFARRCEAAGKPAGTVFGTPEMVAECFANGFRFVACASDLAFMIGQARTAFGWIREAVEGA